MAVSEAAGRKQVQEIASHSGEPPARFVLKDQDRSIGTAPLVAPVPTVNLSRLFLPDGDDEVDRLRSALLSWGLFQATTDEMTSSFIDEVRILAKMFFDLPREEKLKYRNITDKGEFKLEGYGNDRVATEDQILDWNDRLYLLVHPESDRNLELWPDNPSSFRTILHEFTTKLKKIGDCFLRAMAKLLELEENYFTDQFGEDTSMYVRFNYYPSCPRPDIVFGIKPHSDGSAFTILLLDGDVDGLQVLRDGEWFTVPSVPNTLLVNLGDQLEIMSNGIFKSPVHRVVTNSQKERISIAMFFSKSPQKYIEPAGILVDEARPKLYKKFKVEDYLKALFETFAQGKRAIDFARI
ncbi:Protein SRG1 [Apostasia shenzhenica]|uniref:Protein SRG1 n=1 Tax=Apostasia shenzhenica TaxID=1088818 RepID=A0A2I0B0L4_9ASPA|nr:Protein SRG1 [Apostasia shenzhenica]